MPPLPVHLPSHEPVKGLTELRERHPNVTDRQAELVMALVSGATSIAAAARSIGADRPWAVKTLQKAHVQAFAQDVGMAVLGGYALRAIATMGRLLNDKSSSVRLEAARELLNRAGLQRIKRVGSPQQSELDININLGGPHETGEGEGVG